MAAPFRCDPHRDQLRSIALGRLDAGHQTDRPALSLSHENRRPAQPLPPPSLIERLLDGRLGAERRWIEAQRPEPDVAVRLPVVRRQPPNPDLSCRGRTTSAPSSPPVRLHRLPSTHATARRTGSTTTSCQSRSPTPGRLRPARYPGTWPDPADRAAPNRRDR